MASESYGKNINLWDIGVYAHCFKKFTNDARILKLVSIPDQMHILSLDEKNQLKLWNIYTGKNNCFKLSVNANKCLDLSISNDGKKIYIVKHDSIDIVNVFPSFPFIVKATKIDSYSKNFILYSNGEIYNACNNNNSIQINRNSIINVDLNNNKIFFVDFDKTITLQTRNQTREWYQCINAVIYNLGRNPCFTVESLLFYYKFELLQLIIRNYYLDTCNYIPFKVIQLVYENTRLIF